MQMYGELEVQFQAFLNLVLIMVTGKLHTPTALSPRKDPSFSIGSVTSCTVDPVCKGWLIEKSILLPGIDARSSTL
jgi:hypothetical protein